MNTHIHAPLPKKAKKTLEKSHFKKIYGNDRNNKHLRPTHQHEVRVLASRKEPLTKLFKGE